MVSKMLTFILQLIFLPLTSQTTHVRSLGCVIHRSMVAPAENHDAIRLPGRGSFTDMEDDSSGMTVQRCVTRCWNKRFTLAAMQDRTSCFCASDLKDLTSVSDKQCNMRCQGACGQRCGGAVTLSVYETGATNQIVHFMTPSHFDSDTCCCDWDFRIILKSFTQWEGRLCNLPCAGDESQKCAGKTGRDSYFKVYDVHALSAENKGFPQVTRENINTSGLFYPIFPRDNNFEVKEHNPDVIRFLETNKGSLSGDYNFEVKNQETKTERPSTGPVVDPDNSGAGVVDVPETEMTTGRKALLIVLGIVGSLVLITIAYFFYQRYKPAERDLNKKTSISKKKVENKQKGKSAQNKQKKTQKKQKIKKNNVEWNAVPSSTSGSGTDTSSEAVV